MQVRVHRPVRTGWKIVVAASIILLLASDRCHAQFGVGAAVQPVTPVRAVPDPLPHDFGKWEKEVAAYEMADKTDPPPKGAILFLGSSTIRMWKTLADDFPEHKVVNRGIGGSEIVDSTHFAERIIFPYEPKQIFLRAGGNDIHNGGIPEDVASDFNRFVEAVHARLPKTEIVFIFVNPAPSRWGENDKYQDLNKRIREMALGMPRTCCVDAYDISLTPDGKPRHELFLNDKLHFNSEGYKLLAERVRPYLLPTK